MLANAVCCHCGADFEREAGAINRARRSNLNLYCGKTCAGIGRRSNKPRAQKISEKAEYDRKYRRKNSAKRKAQKAEYHRNTYDPEKARVERKKRSAAHSEYCRRPEYRRWKAEYDRSYLARKHYGEFAGCALLVRDIRNECLERMSDYEIRIASGTFNKSQKRKRDYDRLNSNRSEECPLGNA